MYTAKTTTTTMFILMLKGVKYACKYKHLPFLMPPPSTPPRPLLFIPFKVEQLSLAD